MNEVECLRALCDELEHDTGLECCRHCEFWATHVPHTHKTACGMCTREALVGVCIECGKWPADSPSTRCQGCNAYREHTLPY